MISRPLYRINLLSTERRELEQLVRGYTTPQLLAKRARIILMANEEGRSNAEIAGRLGIDKAKVTLWTQRWSERGLEPVLDRLSDLPRPGAPDAGAMVPGDGPGLRVPPSARIPDESLERQGPGRRGDQAGHRRAPFGRPLAKSASKKTLQPHRVRSWLNAKPEARKDERIADLSAPCIRKPHNAPTSWS